ncbi:carbonic anhydrase family protein [Accumulibacter sp.]|uniref:carbonic anhydrase n=1 Tax=Accumulibacter sp. TaxID=2053492 RepID=UPI00262B35D7|nr:carbonic anhydrase family protein [Accumulibacter sp.]
MSFTTDGTSGMHRYFWRLVTLLASLLPATTGATWQVISAEPGKRVEIDRASVRKDESGKSVALGRIILEKPIVDPKTSSYYRIVEALNRYDCASRSYSTLKRTYYKSEGDLLREEDLKVQIEMPVRTGMLDDKLLREVCRPKSGPEAVAAASKIADKVNQAAGELRKANEALLQKEVKRANLQTPVMEKAETEAPPAPPARLIGHPPVASTARPPAAASARSHAARSPTIKPGDSVASARGTPYWTYEGDSGPDNWSKLKPEYATCSSGKRQSPIDIRDGLRVDLEAIQFVYRPSQFRVVDNGHTVQVEVGGSRISLLGKAYELLQFHFHRPSEERVNGKSFDMVAHLVHQAEDGRIAVLAVLFEKGLENPLIQTVWNNLPLEKNDYVTPPDLSIDVAQLLPENRSYYTYMGSLTTPPCTEGVLWLVLKQPQQISAEQLAIFGRLYRQNARPLQPSFGRIIKESR